MSSGRSVAVVGASGAVGDELLRVMERRNFPVSHLRLLASARSAGRTMTFRGEAVPVEELKTDAFTGVDLALFSAGSDISREFAPAAVKAGAVVIDNSSAFRLQDDVPLVIPEINGVDAAKHNGIVANPNCTTAITLMALYPLHCEFHVTRVFAASYQAVSGAGARAIVELRTQLEAMSRGEAVIPEVFPHPIASNAIPQVDGFLDNGYTKEEMKMQNEGRRILHHRRFRASVTCVRVPVYRAHSVAVTAEFDRTADIGTARRALSSFPGLKYVDDPAGGMYPMPLTVAGEDACAVGRLRVDCASSNGLAFWVCGDQLLKGAALNAVQIAEIV